MAPRAMTDAERLLLETHLERCDACCSDRARLLDIRRIALQLPAEPLGSRGHARAIAAAFLEGGAEPAPRSWVGWGLAAAAAALAILLAGVLAIRRQPTVAIAPGIAPPPPSESDSELGMRVTAIAPDLMLEGTRIAAAPDARYRWDAGLLRLDSGALEVAVATDRPFQVATTRFVVAASSAVYRVQLDRVIVRLGTVDVLARDGSVQRRLRAGDVYSTDAEPSTTRALLEDARRAFERGDVDAASRHAAAALAANPSRMEAASARMILADCARADGDLTGALSRYLAIADRFGDLDAGETALFAASRLQATRDRAAAASLLRRYLTRYPAGRFVDDARLQLRTLD